MNLAQAQIITAIVTPFTSTGEIDHLALEKLTAHLLENGSQGFVIGGTTGETPTLTHDEKIELYKKFAQFIDGKVPVIAGCGTNNTKESLAFINEVAEISGIDHALTVVPYYNKPDQDGLKAHFRYLAKNAKLPLIIYNIPGRTGVKMEKETVVELAKEPNIAGIKQCASLEELAYIIEQTKELDFSVYTGEDGQALAAKTLGANGVVSVASHLYGPQMEAMYEKLAHGDVAGAGALQRWLTPRMQALFMYPSPSPVKACLNAQGFNVGGLHLPLLELDHAKKQKLAQALLLPKDALEHKLPLDLGEF